MPGKETPDFAEAVTIRWLDGASSPATAGARFKGWNRFGWMR